MRTTTTLELRPIAELKPYEHNARTHSAEQIEKLRASMREFGFVAPVLITADGGVIAGHGRIEAAALEGFTEAPCVLVDHLTETQRRAYILADNRLAELAAWDMSIVETELLALQDAGFDVELTGFSSELLAEPVEVQEDDFDAEPPAEPSCKPGQLWALGPHRLYCGDATQPESYQILMSGDQAALLHTDPPYVEDYDGGPNGNRNRIANDALPETAAIDFLQAAFENIKASLAPGAAFYIWFASGAPGYIFRRACHLSGLSVRQSLVWVKNSATLSRSDYHWQHEAALAGFRDPANAEELAYGWKDGAAHTWLSDRKQTTALFFDKPNRSEQHPTMKPVKLCAYLIGNSCPPDGIVLDPFAGSGSTLIAAEQLGRRARCMELDPGYCDVIIRRWEDLTGGKAELLT